LIFWRLARRWLPCDGAWFACRPKSPAPISFLKSLSFFPLSPYNNPLPLLSFARACSPCMFSSFCNHFPCCSVPPCMFFRGFPLRCISPPCSRFPPHTVMFFRDLLRIHVFSAFFPAPFFPPGFFRALKYISMVGASDSAGFFAGSALMSPSFLPSPVILEKPRIDLLLFFFFFFVALRFFPYPLTGFSGIFSS